MDNNERGTREKWALITRAPCCRLYPTTGCRWPPPARIMRITRRGAPGERLRNAGPHLRSHSRQSRHHHPSLPRPIIHNPFRIPIPTGVSPVQNIFYPPDARVQAGYCEFRNINTVNSEEKIAPLLVGTSRGIFLSWLDRDFFQVLYSCPKFFEYLLFKFFDTISSHGCAGPDAYLRKSCMTCYAIHDNLPKFKSLPNFASSVPILFDNHAGL